MIRHNDSPFEYRYGGSFQYILDYDVQKYRSKPYFAPHQFKLNRRFYLLK